jgi:hypothetical protein
VAIAKKGNEMTYVRTLTLVAAGVVAAWMALGAPWRTV